MFLTGVAIDPPAAGPSAARPRHGGRSMPPAQAGGPVIHDLATCNKESRGWRACARHDDAVFEPQHLRGLA